MKVQLHPYEKAARVIRLMAWISLLGNVGILAAVAIPQIANDSPIPAEMYFLGLFLISVTAFLFFTARGIFQKKAWARVCGQIYGVLAIFGVPIGTIIGGYILWQLGKGWPEDTSSDVA